jgi:hypothetical protein
MSDETPFYWVQWARRSQAVPAWANVTSYRLPATTIEAARKCQGLFEDSEGDVKVFRVVRRYWQDAILREEVCG